MWLLTLFGAFVCASVSGENSVTSVFRKCCPKNHGLIKVKYFDTEFYECLDVQNAVNVYNVTQLPLFIGSSVVLESGIPELCNELKLTQLASEELNNLNHSEIDICYDRLVEEIHSGTAQKSIPKIVALKCIQNTTEEHPTTKLTINSIRKCCPSGQAYDLTYHVCKRAQEIDENWLIGKLNFSTNYIYEIKNGLHCKSDEYGVELSEELYSLQVEGNRLTALKRVGVGGSDARHSEWCIDGEFGKVGMVARVCTRNCADFGAYCVRKCCPIGEHYRPRRCGKPVSSCVPNEDEVRFDVSEFIDPLKPYGISEVLGVRAELRCPFGKVILNRSSEADYHNLTVHGHLMSKMATNDDYCFEAFDSRHCPNGNLIMGSVICFVKGPVTKNFKISVVLICVSSVCLVLTLVVYCSLRELRNLHGKTLICHVSMMLLAFLCLARVQYDNVSDEQICTMLGYGIYFGFMAAFAWLNVMCLDIWWTFGSMRTVKPMRKSGSDMKRFLWYSLYAWSIAIVFTLTMYLLDKFPLLDYLDSNIGSGMCWFGTFQNSNADWPHYIFFVIPMGVGTFLNLVLFLLTARHCARVKSEVHRMQAGSVGDRAKRRFRIDRAKYVLTAKLWVVMGAGWISEFLSTIATEPQWLWSIVDLLNELQGVFIFLILVFKPKVYYLIRKRLGLEKPAQKPSSSARTSSTFLSRTISSDDRKSGSHRPISIREPKITYKNVTY